MYANTTHSFYTCPHGHTFLIHRGQDGSFPIHPVCEVCNNLKPKRNDTKTVPLHSLYSEVSATNNNSNKNT